MTMKLEPYGDVISGKEGISASRLAEALGVTVASFKKLVAPIGVMKMAGKNSYDVYDADLANTLQNHPDIVKGRARRGGKRLESSKKAADARKERCVRELVAKAQRPELDHLFSSLVHKLWSPDTEQGLLNNSLYYELAVILWDGLLSLIANTSTKPLKSS